MLVEDAEDPMLKGNSTLGSLIIEDAEFDCCGACGPQRDICPAVAIGGHAQRIRATR
jgi:hypothetical protein